MNIITEQMRQTCQLSHGLTLLSECLQDHIEDRLALALFPESPAARSNHSAVNSVVGGIYLLGSKAIESMSLLMTSAKQVLPDIGAEPLSVEELKEMASSLRELFQSCQQLQVCGVVSAPGHRDFAVLVRQAGALQNGQVLQ